MIILENKTLRLEFNPENGALAGLTALQTGWKVLDRPQLGLSYRLMLPLPDRRNNSVFGEEQVVTRVETTLDQHSVTFTWDGVTSQYGGSHAICITQKVTLNERQAVFALGIDNRSDVTIENVYCPYLGDVRCPGDEEWFKAFLCQYATAQEWSIYPNYQNLRGGIEYPVQFAPWMAAGGAPMSPFILLRGKKQGLYVGVAEPGDELVAWHTELRPGINNTLTYNVPQGAVIDHTPVAVRFAAVYLPYIQPGERRGLTPIAFEAYQGDWHAGVDIYKKWRDGWMQTPKLPAWVSEPHSWYQFQVSSPEDELRLSFRDLPKLGEECARHGVKAIQLVGWNDGGQDRGNPSHDFDPRLGTFEEFKEAIASIQAMGVKLILFAKFTWADRATERYRKDLLRLAIKDPFGDPYMLPGYAYHTATALLDINTRRLIPMCFLSQEYLDICNAEFKKTLELGANGILFDECLHHTPALLCFDTSHGHRYGAMVYANDRQLIRNFTAISAPARPDFLFAGEAIYDWEFETYHFSYHRSGDANHIPLQRYLLPHVPLATAVWGFNDRNMVNQCLMYRYIISYEPYFFKGRLDSIPLTLAYGRQMDALRTELRAYFWDGEFRDTLGAEVTVDDKPHHPYAVFNHVKNGKVGLVIANYDEKKTITAHVKLDHGGMLERYRLVDDPAWKRVQDGIVIPPCSAAVSVEE